MFYTKLALNNIQKNKQTHMTFFLSIIFLVIMNVVMQLLLKNKGMSELPKAAIAQSLFGFGSVIIFIFSVIFALYTNSFLLKQRKKELGLYNILGLNKQDIRRMLAIESMIGFLVTISIGVISGLIFSRLAFLIFKKLSKFGEDFVFSIDPKAIGIVILFFFVLFCLLFTWNSVQLRALTPLELLKGSQVGEKEPKANWVMGIFGLLATMAGYIISLTMDSPLKAIPLFFLAVVLVIIGTYALFSSTSIVFLKLLKKNKAYYYQPNHFISVSSMMYRMKQNAAGLASICVLSTMVLVTLSTTTSLYFGVDDMVASRHPFDLSINHLSPKKASELENKLKSLAIDHDIQMTTMESVTMSTSYLFVNNQGAFNTQEERLETVDESSIFLLNFMSQTEYARLTQHNPELKPDEVWLYPMNDSFNEKKLA